VWQLVGVHGNGDTIARQLKASNESEAFHGARELMLQLSGRSASKSSTKHHLRAALEAITSKGYRDATERAKVSGVRQVCEWLAERSLAVDEKALHQAVLELAPEENCKRRSVLESAALLATVAGANLNTESLRYRNPLPTQRPAAVKRVTTLLKILAALPNSTQGSKLQFQQSGCCKKNFSREALEISIITKVTHKDWKGGVHPTREP